MKTKLLFWSATLFLILALNTKDGILFYFFAIHSWMLLIGVVIHRHSSKPHPKEMVEPLPESRPAKK